MNVFLTKPYKKLPSTYLKNSKIDAEIFIALTIITHLALIMLNEIERTLLPIIAAIPTSGAYLSMQKF